MNTQQKESWVQVAPDLSVEEGVTIPKPSILIYTKQKQKTKTNKTKHSLGSRVQGLSIYSEHCKQNILKALCTNC